MQSRILRNSASGADIRVEFPLSATHTNVEDKNRRTQVGTLWWNKGPDPKQATLALRRGGSTNIKKMLLRMMYHPLATHSDGSLVNAMMLKGKVNAQSRATEHESEYNIKLTTILAFNLTVGYSRHGDPTGHTHAWVAFGKSCTEQWQKEMGVVFC